MQYCSIEEAWNSNNTIEGFANTIQHDLDEYKQRFSIDNNQRNDYQKPDINKYDYLSHDPKVNNHGIIDSKPSSEEDHMSREENHIISKKGNVSNKKHILHEESNIFEESESKITKDIDFSELEDLSDEEPVVKTKKRVKFDKSTKHIKKSEPSCNELINKVISCEKCLKLFKNKLNLHNNFLDTLLSDNNREIFMVILMGIFTILILDLFVRIGKNFARK